MMEAVQIKSGQQVDLNPQNHPSDPTCIYEKCGGTGLVHIERDGYDFTSICQCAKDQAKLRFLGKRFFNVKLENLNPRSPKQIILKDILISDTKKSVFLFGEGGTGKTHFLAAMYNYWERKRIKYLDDAMLKDELKNAELNRDMSFVQDLVNDHDFIFLDDVGKQAMTPFHQGALYKFFNELYKQKKHIFITANDSLEVLGGDEYWGSHVARRVEDICTVVQF